MLSASGDPAPAWGPGRCDFNGTDQAFLGDVAIDLETDFTVVAKARVDPVSAEHMAVGIGDPTYGCRFVLGCFTSGKYRCLFREDDNTNIVNVYNNGPEFDDGYPHQLAFSFAKSLNEYYCLVDTTVINTSTPWAYTAIHATKISIGSAYYAGNLTTHWPGSIYYVYVYRRALTPGEIGQLFHEPFAMFGRPTALVAGAHTTGGVVGLTGSCGAVSACNANAEIVRRLSGSALATSACAALGRLHRRLGGSLMAGSTASGFLSETGTVTLSGTIQTFSTLAGALQLTPGLPLPQAAPASEMAWLTDALLNGATGQAFKLGTALTRGWFWVRQEGCSAIYRGPGADAVDFGNILDVVERHPGAVTVPTCLFHGPDSTYCYVVRRFNSCGRLELTTSAAVVIRIDSEGKLADSVPNEVFGLEAQPTDGSRIRLRWFYCPLDQEAAPEVFKVYGDGGTGQIDLETVLATIPYEGRKFYSYQSGVLENGEYAFVVRAERAGGATNPAMVAVSCSMKACQPEAATILAAEAIS
jgi:hypothetical protein